MGLDGYLYRENSFDTEFASTDILTGELSSKGLHGVFRAKLYDDIVKHASGGSLTLYTESGDTQWCGRVADALSKLLQDNPVADVFTGRYVVSREALVALESLFRQAFQKGCQYWGSW